jgi:hypothetical protein
MNAVTQAAGVLIFVGAVAVVVVSYWNGVTRR